MVTAGSISFTLYSGERVGGGGKGGGALWGRGQPTYIIFFFGCIAIVLMQHFHMTGQVTGTHPHQLLRLNVWREGGGEGKRGRKGEVKERGEGEGKGG